MATRALVPFEQLHSSTRATRTFVSFEPHSRDATTRALVPPSRSRTPPARHARSCPSRSCTPATRRRAHSCLLGKPRSAY
nr:MAG: hypothetical protein DIU78_08315 [Pseudomonadota bacterium]